MNYLDGNMEPQEIWKSLNSPFRANSCSQNLGEHVCCCKRIFRHVYNAISLCAAEGVGIIKEKSTSEAFVFP